MSPLSQEAINELQLRSGATGVRPGSVVSMQLGRWECCVFFQRVPACATYTIDPPDAATLEEIPWTDDPWAPSLRLEIDPDTPHGTVISVTANVETGRRVLQAELHVYTLEANPLVGFWRERARLPCGGFVRADTDGNGEIQISDAVTIFHRLFFGAGDFSCAAAADANADRVTDLSDGVYLLNFLFLGGPPPPPPFPVCGRDPESPFGCDIYDGCESEEIVPEWPIQELVFRADGSFTVTWLPFEVYVDYWGTYTFDLDMGEFDLVIDGGNFVPSDVACLPRCRFSIEDGELHLRDTWLGTHDEFRGGRGCGHVFER